MSNNLKQFAMNLAHKAGLKLLELYRNQNPAEGKLRTAPKEMKLVEDRTMDQWLVQTIQAQYPEHAILIEESGYHAVKNAEVVWIIDPIDGSVNFSTHNPFVAISLAVQINHELVVGIIEAPLLGEQFVAVKDEGATVNGKPIHVSNTKALAQAYIVSCDGGVKDRKRVLTTLVDPYYTVVKDLRKLGSAALECAWVAVGRADAYITMAIDPWDVAAGVLLVQEAGGAVTTFDKKIWSAKRSDLVCSNGLLHEQVISQLS